MRGNSNSYGVQPGEEPIYNWRTVINSATDLYFEGNIHQSLQNIPENQLVQPALLQQKGGKGMWIPHSLQKNQVFIKAVFRGFHI